MHKLTRAIRTLPKATEKQDYLTIPINCLDDFITSYFKSREKQYQKVWDLVKKFELIKDV